MKNPETVKKNVESRKKSYKYRPAWNKGSTKETDPRVKKNAESTSRARKGKFKGELNPFYGRHHSEISIIKIRKAKLENYKEHPEIIEKIKIARLNQVIPQKDTKIEILMQKGLKDKGLIFKTHYPIIGQPDIAFPNKKIAIFCDGCYWHACPIHFPNGRDRDMGKDRRIEKTLTEMGWVVLRFWEHEINEDLEGCISKVMGLVT